ncbi:hypothetical protein BKA70DRAFT_1339582 [Coprinopsis sp. MPI-PUGE-AT-0042]|nr:hypothetical protein BKA70DRAFT_1339582 [Coprinopsis sp. MPI-PUGE-AT-0042]
MQLSLFFLKAPKGSLLTIATILKAPLPQHDNASPRKRPRLPKQPSQKSRSDSRLESIHGISELEDTMHRDQRYADELAERPDLPSYAVYRSTVVADSGPSRDAVDDLQDVNMGSMSSGALSEHEDPPLSDSNGLAMDLSGEKDEEDWDDGGAAVGGVTLKGDENSAEVSGQDDEVDLLSDEESQKIFKAMKMRMRAKKAQADKGNARVQVNQGRKTQDVVPPVSGGKASSTRTASSARSTSTVNIQGLKKSWKPPTLSTPPAVPSQDEDSSGAQKNDPQPAPIRRPKTPAVSPPPSMHTANPHPQHLGNVEQDHDDSVEAPPPPPPPTRQVKAAKLKQKKGTAKMGLAVTEVGVPSTVKAIAIPNKVKASYKIEDLEFGHILEERKKWSSIILPSLYDWLGTQRDIFSIYAHPQFEAVLRDAWDSTFNGDWDMDKVAVRLAGSSTRSYKSGFVKRSFKVVASHFVNQQITTKDGRIKEVKRLLADDTFIYKDVVGDKKSGAYRGPLLMELYARHQRTVDSVKDYTYGNPAGALAWCATALERALSLWKKGDDPQEKGNFVRNPWDKQLEHHFKTTPKLGEKHWDTIKTLSREIYQSGAEVVDSEGENDDEEAKEPRDPVQRPPEIVLTSEEED